MNILLEVITKPLINTHKSPILSSTILVMLEQTPLPAFSTVFYIFSAVDKTDKICFLSFDKSEAAVR